LEVLNVITDKIIEMAPVWRVRLFKSWTKSLNEVLGDLIEAF